MEKRASDIHETVLRAEFQVPYAGGHGTVFWPVLNQGVPLGLDLPLIGQPVFEHDGNRPGVAVGIVLSGRRQANLPFTFSLHIDRIGLKQLLDGRGNMIRGRRLILCRTNPGRRNQNRCAN